MDKGSNHTIMSDNYNELNTGIDTFNWRNGHDYTSNWSGTISIAANSVTKFSKIFGKITHKSATAPTWGETVCKITYTGNSVPLMVYSNRGQVYNAFVLSGTGEIKVYGSDKQYMVHSGEEFTFCTYIT